jgi:lipopolysaccharide export system protein LptA
MQLKKPIKLVIVVVALGLVPGIMALPSDKQQPMLIQSDRWLADGVKNTATYTGDVKVTQGTLKIDADTVTLYRNKSGNLVKIIAHGNPAYYQQQPEPDKPLVKGHALVMKYFADKDMVSLLQQAHLEQGPNSFNGEHIDYHIEQQLVNAFKGVDNQKPIEIVIHPQQTDHETKK